MRESPRPSGKKPEGRDVNLPEGRLGLLEAHREFDRKHQSGAKFMTFAFPRVQRKVQEAVEALGGVPRGVHRAAKRVIRQRTNSAG